eukprot:1059852_1
MTVDRSNLSVGLFMRQNVAQYKEHWLWSVYQTIWLLIQSFTQNKTSLLVLVALNFEFRTNSALSLSTGSHSRHTCAFESNKPNFNGFKCWGFNMYGQLGQGHTNTIGDAPNEMGSTLPNIDTGISLTEIAHVATAGAHTCLLTTTNQIKCFGSNAYGELGYGDTMNRGDAANTMADNLPFVDLGTNRTPIQIATGYSHTCVVLFNDALGQKEVKCYGKNNFGQLGYGHTNNTGDEPGEMGDNLLPIDLGIDFEPVQVTAGAFFTCALSSTGKVSCWGRNVAGQLGNGDTDNRGDEPGEMGVNLTTIDLGSNFLPVKIEAGYKTVCALSDAGTVKCWGWNGYGCLGYGNTVNIGDNVGEMGNNLALVELGTGFVAIGIFAGGYHMCALSEGRNIKCFGSNSYGNLGYGHTNHIGDGVGEMGDNLAFVDLGNGFNDAIAAVQGSPYHTCAVSLSDKVKCWGGGTNGMLGSGATNNVGDDVGEMGINLPIVDLVFVSPTEDPTKTPTLNPTMNPTIPPTNIPTIYPTINPTKHPTAPPTINPTLIPTNNPSASPIATNDPTRTPSNTPTAFPTITLSNTPTTVPTITPSIDPTAFPTITPSNTLTTVPTITPSIDPTAFPTATTVPTITPSIDPTAFPTITPSNTPSMSPSDDPTQDPLEGRQTAESTDILVDDVTSSVHGHYDQLSFGSMLVVNHGSNDHSEH